MKVYLVFIVISLLSCNLIFAQNKKDVGFLLPYEKNCKYGLVSVAGKVILKPEFDYIDFFKTIFKVQKIEGGKVFYGAISKQGKIILPCMFDDLYVKDGNSFTNHDIPKENFIVALSNKSKRFFTLKGKEFYLKESLFQIGASCGATSYTIPFEIFPYNNKYGVVSYKNDTIVKPIYDYIEIMSRPVKNIQRKTKCYFIVTKNGLSGILNETGEVITPIEYDNISFTPYSEINLFVAAKNKLYTIIDTLGLEIFPPYYNSIEVVLANSKYFFIVSKDNLNAVIDYFENVFVPFTINSIANDYSLLGFIITNKRTNQKGFHSYKNFTIPCEYAKLVTIENDRFALVQRENTCKFYYDMKLKREIRFKN
jgi:WG containing repeat